MKLGIFQRLTAATAATALIFLGSTAFAEPRHGIAMYGEPALPPDFVSLPYANPDAPKGGRIIFGEAGGFDSMNPYIEKGRAPYGVSLLTVETLLGRSYDEAFTLYGLLAESVDTDSDRTYVEFTLRPEAKFSDGTPVTVEDVLWSFETLGTIGSPRYSGAWKKVATAERTGERSVKFTFNTVDRELPLILGLRPILQKAFWQDKDFTATSFDVPIGSGPYVVDSFKPGSTITYKKDPDWWGADLNFYRGMHNFDEITYDYYGDGNVVFEAFKAGEFSTYREGNPAKWASNYDFPRVVAGEVVKDEIAHQRPSGIEGFVMNTRRPMFTDYRVRQALIEAFNAEFINVTLNGGVNPRIQSYYSNSGLGAPPGQPAQGRVAELLDGVKDSLLPGAMEGYAVPVSDGSKTNRAGIRAATALLEEAGWALKDGQLVNAADEPFAFEILLQQGQDDATAVANIYTEALKPLGIAVKVTTIDQAQMKDRTTNYDFDMTYYIRSLSLSPGNEQMLYWGAAGVSEPGTRNWMGMNSPAAEAMIQTMLSAKDHDDFVAATQALDRILISGRYVIPFWYSQVSRLAHVKELHYPENLPIYGDWQGFQPEVWWYQD
jgi:peptide/nickel transport system substrate-binding protein